jgi:Fe-S-cluster containining protein
MAEAARDQRLNEVREVYSELAARPVERNCTGIAQCCSFRVNGRTPFLTKGEALVAAKAWRAAGRKEVVLPPDGSCPFLGRNGRCQIYEARPFGCRTHFCEAAGGPYARGEVRDLIQRLEAIDHQLGGSGGVNLATAVTAAMDELDENPNRGNAHRKRRHRGR